MTGPTALDPAVADAAVESWAKHATSWTTSDRSAVAAALVRAAAFATPYVVHSGSVPPADLQAFLLDRAVRRIDDRLIAVAATLRAGLGLTGERVGANGVASLGLRSARPSEIAGAAGVGERVARAIRAHLARHPETATLDELDDVDGIGPATLERLRSATHLERRNAGLISPTLWAFLHEPGVPTLLALLERTDLFPFAGDENAVVRRLADTPASPIGRFLAFLGDVAEDLALSSSLADAALATDVQTWVWRRAARAGLDSETEAGLDSHILVDGEYVGAVRDALAAATGQVDVMMFLATASLGTPADPGPGVLVDALTDAYRNGAAVRVVLDQDDGGEPYHSLTINRPLVRRLREAGIPVRFEDPLVLLHSKVVIADDVTVVGSHNWTGSGLRETGEVSVLVAGAAYAARARERFDAMWSRLPVP